MQPWHTLHNQQQTQGDMTCPACPAVVCLWCRRPYERLLRKVLSLPNNPAVILLHGYAWFRADPYQGNFYNSAERDYNDMAEYYGLPAVSVKSCCYEAMRNAEPGFQVSRKMHLALWQSVPHPHWQCFSWCTNIQKLTHSPTCTTLCNWETYMDVLFCMLDHCPPFPYLCSSAVGHWHACPT